MFQQTPLIGRFGGGGGNATPNGLVYYFPIGGGVSDSDALQLVLDNENARADGPRLVQIGQNGHPLILRPGTFDPRCAISIKQDWRNVRLRGNESVPIHFAVSVPPYLNSPFPAAFFPQWSVSPTSLVLAAKVNVGESIVVATTSVAALLTPGDILLMGGADGLGNPDPNGAVKPFRVVAVAPDDRTILLDTPVFDEYPAATTHLWAHPCPQNISFDFDFAPISGTGERFLSLPNVYGVTVINARFTDDTGIPHQLVAFDNNSKFTLAEAISTEFKSSVVGLLQSALTYETSDWAIARNVACECETGAIAHASSSHFAGSNISIVTSPDSISLQLSAVYGCPCHAIVYDNLTQAARPGTNLQASTAVRVENCYDLTIENWQCLGFKRWVFGQDARVYASNVTLDQRAVALPGATVGGGTIYGVEIEASTAPLKLTVENITWYGLDFATYGVNVWNIFENGSNGIVGHEIDFRGRFNYFCPSRQSVAVNTAHSDHVGTRRDAVENPEITTWDDGFGTGTHISKGTIVANGLGTVQNIAFCVTTQSDTLELMCTARAGTPGVPLVVRTEGTGFAVTFAAGDTSTYEYTIK